MDEEPTNRRTFETNFPTLRGQDGSERLQTPSWPTVRKGPREAGSWGEIQEVRGLIRDAAHHNDEIRMKSLYFLIRKEGGTSFRKRKMITTVCGGDLRMVRSYTRDGREHEKVVQVTCDEEVEIDLLKAMKKERIRQLQIDYQPLKLTSDHPVRGAERRRIEGYHVKLVLTQWRRAAGAAGIRSTREHFARLVQEGEEAPGMQADIQRGKRRGSTEKQAEGNQQTKKQHPVPREGEGERQEGAGQESIRKRPRLDPKTGGEGRGDETVRRSEVRRGEDQTAIERTGEGQGGVRVNTSIV